MGPDEGEIADSLWRMRLIQKLSKLPIEPPAEKEAEKPKPYCITCDSSYCTCKKEKQ